MENEATGQESLAQLSGEQAAVLLVPLPLPYDFAGCTRGHGWYVLEPYAPTDLGIRRVERVASGRVVLLDLSYDPARAAVAIATDCPLTSAEEREVRAKVGWGLRADEDLADFYAACAARGGSYVLAIGKGRLLRSPTLFEDAVKVVLTTNTTWRQTKAMVSRLVQGLGEPHPADPRLRAFPTPESILAAGEGYLGSEARLGYRAPAVLALAARAEEMEGLREAALTTEELRQQLLSFRGVGPYAAATLLMLLGRYDFLAVDSELRSFTTRKYFAGTPPAAADLARLYQDWGRWQYLGYWLDRWLDSLS